MITPGATPKLTTSDKESSCLPTNEVACNNRARNPSKKSTTAAMPIHIEDHANFSGMLNVLENWSLTYIITTSVCKANTIATQPRKRLSKVNRLGICFNDDILS